MFITSTLQVQEKLQAKKEASMETIKFHSKLSKKISIQSKYREKKLMVEALLN